MVGGGGTIRHRGKRTFPLLEIKIRGCTDRVFETDGVRHAVAEQR